MSEKFVVDTNVILVANKSAEQASPGCVQNCSHRLNFIRNKGHIILDDGQRIFNEYRSKTLKKKGQREVGDEFVLWLITNLWNSDRCTQVRLTPKKTDDADFTEFPDHPDLSGFDRSDRVFVAVANAHKDGPPICAACDSDHWNFRSAFQKCGIKIDFLCPNDVEKISNRKAS